jgi:hypothetical protein
LRTSTPRIAPDGPARGDSAAVVTFRRLVLVLSLVAALLLGADKLGLKLFPSGKDVAFKATPSASPAGLTLEADAGDLTCWLRLKVAGPDRKTVHAELDGGPPLAVDSDGDWLLIRRSPSGPDPDRKFAWPSGVLLRLTCAPDGPTGVALEDWFVYCKDGSYDSMSRATGRAWWFWISLGLFGLSLVSPVYEGWNRLTAKPEAVSPERVVAGMIESVGEGVKDGAVLSGLLREVILRQRTREEAFDALKIRGKSAQGQKWFTATSRFKSRLGRYIDELNAYRKLLE